MTPMATYYCPQDGVCEPCEDCDEGKNWRCLIPVIPFLAGVTVLVLGILGHFKAINLLDTSYHLPFIYAGAAGIGASFLSLILPCIIKPNKSASYTPAPPVDLVDNDF